jgi:transcriptional regulator with XRE-family HTH domain
MHGGLSRLREVKIQTSCLFKASDRLGILATRPLEVISMKKINPFVLKRLRNQKGWSQEKLGEIAKIDKQTIWRIEAGKADAARPETVRRLARAFSVEEAVLTGDASVPENASERERPKLPRLPIDSGVPNALYLIMERYKVPAWQVLELAPFLFCWAAEASLRQRRDRISQFKRMCEIARNLAREIEHLDCGPGDVDEVIAAEMASIERRDLFAFDISMETPELYTVSDELLGNPFASFLNGLAAEFEDVMELEQCPWEEPPIYRVCLQEAKELAGDDSELVDAIFDAHLTLFEMPKEFRYNPEAQAKWIRERAEEYRKQHFVRANVRPATSTSQKAST